MQIVVNDTRHMHRLFDWGNIWPQKSTATEEKAKKIYFTSFRLSIIHRKWCAHFFSKRKKHKSDLPSLCFFSHFFLSLSFYLYLSLALVFFFPLLSLVDIKFVVRKTDIFASTHEKSSMGSRKRPNDIFSLEPNLVFGRHNLWEHIVAYFVWCALLMCL